MTDVVTTSVGPPQRTAAPAASAPARTAAKTPYRPSSAPVYIGAFTLFACFALLFASRMAAGEDPALGLTPGALAQPAPPGVLQRLVVTRRISLDGLTRAQIRRRHVDRVIVVRRPAPSRATVAAVAAGGTGDPSPTPVAATTTAPAATRRSQRASSGDSTDPATDPAASPQAPTPGATAPVPVAATPVAPEPAAAPAPAVPVPAAAPAPVANTTS